MYWSQVRILAGPPKNMENFDFTNNWFKDAAKFQWDRLIPKLAIDSFVNLYSGKISMLNAPAYQIYVKKISN